MKSKYTRKLESFPRESGVNKMTFCETLKSETTASGYTVIAEKSTEKFENGSNYRVYVAEGSLAFLVIPCAKTTWRKRFAETVEQYR